MPIPNTIRVKS